MGNHKRECLICHRPLTTGRSDQLTCSVLCRQIKHKGVKPRRTTCAWCFKPFEVLGRAGKLYHSRSCQQKAYRYRKGKGADRQMGF